MEQNRKYRGEWCGTSHLKEKREELLKAHKEFLEMIADGYKIKCTGIKHKRPRIQKVKTPKEVIVSVFGGKLKIAFTDYQQKGQGLKVLMEIF